jgi:SAM-dependent methyltransferase
MTALSFPDSEAFIARWRDSSASERSNYQMFLSELADLLGQARPDPARGTPAFDDYCFDRPVPFRGTGTTGFIDLYKRGCFVLEAKQGSSIAAAAHHPDQLSLLPDAPAAIRRGTAVRGNRSWDDAMIRARGQAEAYARALPDEYPPFLVTADIGHVIELWADFSRTGKNYSHFPDATRFRIRLDDLRDDTVRNRLRLVWSDPDALDPARTAARVTREIAGRLAALGNSFEVQGHAPERVARFLMRCLFSMFAEDVRLIPEHSFRDLLTNLRGTPEHVAPTLQSLWASMNAGGFSPVLHRDVLRFNGGLFADTDALPVDNVQLSLLIEAATANWREVEPAIFGTLLERALSPRDRHKLGAHYTPRPYVERLVLPTLVEPLRADWENARAAALRLTKDGKAVEAHATLHAFHRQLCQTRVLDPACGSGNFLYVALEAMKRLEGEVTDLLREMGETQDTLHLEGLTVDPHQFLGIELNPWAAAVAELVLWIGYLQWHYRTHGRAAPSEPVLRDFRNIENRDAVLAWDATAPRLDAEGRLVTRWDGIGTIRHPVTGDPVPDPDPEAHTQVLDYFNPRPAQWPDATFIIGNPPFIGNKRMREALGDGYTEALRRAYPKVPQSADFVMYWWEKAALRGRAWDPAKGTGTRRFGLITTNSLRQTFNRSVVATHLSDRKHPLSLLFAIPDHPWVEASDGAAVRIAMTVGAAGMRDGRLLSLVDERAADDEFEGQIVDFEERSGRIFPDLFVGADVAGASTLKANSRVAYQGVIPGGDGFKVPETTATGPFSSYVSSGILKRYLNGQQLTDFERPNYVIDFFGFSEADARSAAPELIK